MKKIALRCLVVLGVFVASGAVARAGLVDLNVEADRTTVWNGASPGFQPDWVVDTTTVDLTPQMWTILGLGNNYSFTSTSTSTSTFGFIFGHGVLSLGDRDPSHSHQVIVGWEYVPRQEQRWTVNRLSASTSAWTSATTDYQIAGNAYDASEGKTIRGVEFNSAELAHAAEIVTDDGLLLADASAVACQDAQFGDHSFTATGRVSATGILRNGAEWARSDAQAKSCFETSYSFEKATPFSLSLDMAKYDNVDLVFSVVDNSTGDVVLDLTPDYSRTSRQLEASGELGPGEYTFALEAAAHSLISEDGLQQRPGVATYDVALDFETEEYWVTVFDKRPVYVNISDLLASTEERDIVIYQPSGESYTLHISPSANGANIRSVGTTVRLAGTSVPEPATLTLLAGFFVMGLLRRRSK
ncbi:MAG TPA: PEP-CTERM sorting domain-containing protein [Thermoguttaceae bacterium]|nr:PEP-CTERM sorting domain-containing protein [Thermoguttaceae bacterium]